MVSEPGAKDRQSLFCSFSRKAGHFISAVQNNSLIGLFTSHLNSICAQVWDGYFSIRLRKSKATSALQMKNRINALLSLCFFLSLFQKNNPAIIVVGNNGKLVYDHQK